MPVNLDDILQLLCKLADEAELKVALTESAKGGLIAAGSTMAGGLVAGPIGMAVGGAIGGAIAAYSSYGKFRPVSAILMDMESDKKQLLYKSAMQIMSNLGPTDMVGLTALVMGSTEIRQQLVGAVRNHVTNQLQMPIID